MARVLQDGNLIIVYSKHFLFFEWKLYETDTRKNSTKQSSKFNLGGECDSFLEKTFDSSGKMCINLYNSSFLGYRRWVINISDLFDRDISTIIISNYNSGSLGSLGGGKSLFALLTSFSDFPSEYPILISCTVKSASIAIFKELNISQETTNSMNELSSDLKKIIEQAYDTDIILQTGGENIQAHKIIMQARSPVFRRMFDHDSIEAAKNMVVIPDIGSATMKRLVSFLYTGKMEKCNFNETMELYYAADKYEVMSLRGVCKAELLNNLDVNNACSLFSLAKQHSDEEFKKSVVQFVCFNFTDVINSEQFLEMSKEDIALLTRLCAPVVRK